MKKLLLLFAITAVLNACKKQQLLTYNTDDNIYFNSKHNNLWIDSVLLSFAYSPATVTDSTIYIQVMVTGTAKSTDRAFTINADPSSTAKPGTNYSLPDKFVMHAGSLNDSFAVKLFRTPDLQTNALSLTLNLTPGNDFHTDLKEIAGQQQDSANVLSYKIVFSDVLTQGTFWTSTLQPYFGTFTVKKLKLINQVTGMPLDYVITGIYDLNLNARCATWAIVMSRYLKDQAQAGQPVYEDDGVTLMTMGTNYQ